MISKKAAWAHLNNYSRRIKNKAEDLLEVIRNGMDRDREVSNRYREQSQQQPISVADELTKLAALKKRGIISEDEFQQMKQDLIKKKI